MICKLFVNISLLVKFDYTQNPIQSFDRDSSFFYLLDEFWIFILTNRIIYSFADIIHIIACIIACKIVNLSFAIRDEKF